MAVSIVCIIYQETQVAAVAEGLFDKQKSSVNLQNALEGMLLLPILCPSGGEKNDNLG